MFRPGDLQHGPCQAILSNCVQGVEDSIFVGLDMSTDPVNWRRELVGILLWLPRVQALGCLLGPIRSLHGAMGLILPGQGPGGQAALPVYTLEECRLRSLFLPVAAYVMYITLRYKA